MDCGTEILLTCEHRYQRSIMKFFKQLFGSAEPSHQAPLDKMGAALHGNDLEAKVEVLRALVLDLLREVEALRGTQLVQSQANGIRPKESLYGRIYRDTALLTHDETGPSSGIEKLLDLWRARPIFRFGEDSQYTGYGNEFTGELAEVAMLKRLGFSPAEIDRYIEDVEECMLRT